MGKSTTFFKNSKEVLEAKFNYIKENHIDIYDEEKEAVAPIFGYTNNNMLKNYGISNKELVESYLNKKENKKI